MNWENAMVHQTERSPTRLILCRIRLASWTVLALLGFSALTVAGDRSLHDWNRDSPCRFAEPKPEPVETPPARTISAARLLLELAKDAVGVSKLTDGLFSESASEAQRVSGVTVLIKLLMYLSGGNMIPPRPKWQRSSWWLM